MKKRYEGKFIGFDKLHDSIILYHTHDSEGHFCLHGEAHLPLRYVCKDIAKDMMFGDHIEFYCDDIKNQFAISAVDVRIIKNRQWK